MKIKNIIASCMVMFSSMVFADDFTVATGSQGGGYEALGYKITSFVKQGAERKKIKMEYEVLNTNGSIENIQMFSDGEAQVAVVQADALNVMKPSKPFKSRSAHQEVVYWFSNKENGYDDLSDIEGQKDVVMVLVEGSGAEITMQNFTIEDSGYKVNYQNAIRAYDLYEAFAIVSEGKFNGKKVAGVLHVTKPGAISRELLVDFGRKVVIGEATDSDFNDAKDSEGQPLYETCEVTKQMRAGFQTATTFSPDTVCMRAKVIYTTDFEDRDVERIVSRGIIKATR